VTVSVPPHSPPVAFTEKALLDVIVEPLPGLVMPAAACAGPVPSMSTPLLANPTTARARKRTDRPAPPVRPEPLRIAARVI
jgi:hypothetical protein